MMSWSATAVPSSYGQSNTCSCVVVRAATRHADRPQAYVEAPTVRIARSGDGPGSRNSTRLVVHDGGMDHSLEPDHMTEAGQRLVRTVDGFTGDDWAAPSLLPG